MLEGPDRRAFQVVSSPLSTNSSEFREVAKAIAATDTLDAFLRDMRARYPETGALAPQHADPTATAPATDRARPVPGTQTRGAPGKEAATDGGRVARR